MSAIASFHRFREADLAGLREAVRRDDGFWDYVHERGTEVLTFDGSGHIFSTLIPFLQEKRAIDLMTSSRAEFADFLCETRGSLFIVLTTDDRQRLQPALDPATFDEAELRDYYNEFTETDEPESGEFMLNAIKALHTALDAVEDGSVVILHIG